MTPELKQSLAVIVALGLTLWTILEVCRVPW
jgi:hypothetical protein